MPETQTTSAQAPTTQKAVAALIKACASIAEDLAAVRTVYGVRFDGTAFHQLPRAIFDLIESENGHETEWRRDVNAEGKPEGGRYWSKKVRGLEVTAYTDEPPVQQGGVSEVVELGKRVDVKSTVYVVGSDGVARVGVFCSRCFNRVSPTDAVDGVCPGCRAAGLCACCNQPLLDPSPDVPDECRACHEENKRHGGDSS